MKRGAPPSYTPEFVIVQEHGMLTGQQPHRMSASTVSRLTEGDLPLEHSCVYMRTLTCGTCKRLG